MGMQFDGDPVERLRELSSELHSVAESLAGEKRKAELVAIRSQLDVVVAELRVLILRRFGRKPRATRGEGARQAILSYLRANLGQWVEGEELAAVSGIGEWARRVRELRVQYGYDVPQRKGRYRLLNPEPDEAAAKRWQTMNAIRRKSGSGTARIKEFLTAYVGEAVTRDDIDYVGKIKEAVRRARELRDEEGWPLDSHLEDRQLKPGQYRLVSIAPEDLMDSRQRLYPENLRGRVFERDNYTCEKCNRDSVKAEKAGDRRFYLEIHHRNAVAEQLDDLSLAELNDESNLATLCHRCHVAETSAFQKKRRGQRKA